MLNSLINQPEKVVSSRRGKRHGYGRGVAADRATVSRPIRRVEVAILLQDKTRGGNRPGENDVVFICDAH